jgi:hypothetical protein
VTSPYFNAASFSLVDQPCSQGADNEPEHRIKYNEPDRRICDSRPVCLQSHLCLHIPSSTEPELIKNGQDHECQAARERARLSDVQNDAAVYFAFSQSTENFIDGIERELLDRRLHFAFGGKGERFLKIFSCAHDRASESVAT